MYFSIIYRAQHVSFNFAKSLSVLKMTWELKVTLNYDMPSSLNKEIYYRDGN